MGDFSKMEFEMSKNYFEFYKVISTSREIGMGEFTHWLDDSLKNVKIRLGFKDEIPLDRKCEWGNLIVSEFPRLSSPEGMIWNMF